MSCFQQNLVVETSGEVYLEQNLTRKMILTSVSPVQIHAKSAKNNKTFEKLTGLREKLFGGEKQNEGNRL